MGKAPGLGSWVLGVTLRTAHWFSWGEEDRQLRKVSTFLRPFPHKADCPKYNIFVLRIKGAA